MNTKHVKHDLFPYKYSNVFLICYLFGCFFYVNFVSSESEKVCDGGDVAPGTKFKKHLIRSANYYYSCIKD